MDGLARLAELKRFWENTRQAYSLVNSVGLENRTESDTREPKNDGQKEFADDQEYLRNAITVLLAALWIYISKLAYGDGKHYKGNATEVILVRDCIMHDDSISTKNYWDNSPLKRHKLGERIRLDDGLINDFFGYIKTEVEQILAKNTNTEIK